MNKKQRLAAIAIAVGLILGIGGFTFAFFASSSNPFGSNNITVQTDNGLIMTLMDDNIKSLNGAIDSQNLKFTTYLNSTYSSYTWTRS